MRTPVKQWTASVALALMAAACSRQPDFDLIVRGGTVYDGTGEPTGVRRADVGITGDRITAIGDLTARTAPEMIDATGKVVAPGFIDIASRSGVSLLAGGFGESHLRQGITSEILGENSPAFWTMATADTDALQRAGLTLDWSGLNGYYAKLEARGTAINVGTMVPLSLARAAPDRIAFIDAALRDGAFGVIDDVNADAAELTPAATAAGRHDAVVTMRIESPVASDEASLLAVGAQSPRIVIIGVSRLPGDALSAFVQQIVRAGRRNVTVSDALSPYAPTPDASDMVIRDALKYGGTLVATETAAVSGASAPPDTAPAAFGAFARLLGQLSRDDHVLELREAIRRNTSMAASMFQLARRGIVRENYFADLVVFDAGTIADRSTFEMPNQFPAGVDYVIVNGIVTLTPRGLTGSRTGTRLVHGMNSR